jgi:ABC-type glycerol-3-phosphate transport system substrate-binding protein
MTSLTRRTLIKIAAGAAGGGLLAACVAPAARPAQPQAPTTGAEEKKAPEATPVPPAQEVTLQMWSIWDLEKEMQVSQELAKFTEKNHGIKVEHTLIPEWETKFRTAAAGKQLPDVFSTDGVNIPAYACRGLLEDLTPIIPKEVLDDYFRPVKEEMVWNGSNGLFPSRIMRRAFTTTRTG